MKRWHKERTERWRTYLATIEPTSCYNVFAKTPTDDDRNWALFTGVSEFFRQKAGIGGSTDFIELQIASQLKFLDENGMYMDNSTSPYHITAGAVSTRPTEKYALRIKPQETATDIIRSFSPKSRTLSA